MSQFLADDASLKGGSNHARVGVDIEASFALLEPQLT